MGSAPGNVRVGRVGHVRVLLMYDCAMASWVLPSRVVAKWTAPARGMWVASPESNKYHVTKQAGKHPPGYGLRFTHALSLCRVRKAGCKGRLLRAAPEVAAMVLAPSTITSFAMRRVLYMHHVLRPGWHYQLCSWHAAWAA